MKTSVIVCLIILVCVAMVTCSRRRRRGRTTADIRASASRSGGSLTGSINHRRNNWNVGAQGSVDTRGRWSVGVGASFRFGKRSIDWNGKHYTVNLDQCFFGFYDLNNDGVLEKMEMLTIFGANARSDELFEALDITTGDGKIDAEEFDKMAEMTIDGCQKVQQV